MSPDSSWTPENLTENSSQPLLNVCISFAILETFFIIAFLFSWYFNNCTNNNNVKPVLYLILMGYIFCFGGVVLGILKITEGGAGYHVKALPPQTLRIMLQLVKAHEFVYVASIIFPKLAILVLYFRLFPSKTIVYTLYATTLLVVATFIFGIVAAFSNCRPFSAFWDRTQHARCTMDVMTAFRYYSIPNIISDAILLILPLPSLRRLQGELLTKIGLYLTFLTMTFGIVTAVLRFVSFLDVNVFRDITYLCISTTSWTIIEPGVYLVAATMPTLRPLVRRLFKQANDICPSPIQITSCFRQSTVSNDSSGDVTEPRRALRKKSSKSLNRDFLETIGHKTSRPIRLDDYHYLQDPTVTSLRSMDEESLVCADARNQERLASVGRNPDGTLRIWSLGPVQFSPLRTSFFLEKELKQ